MWVHVLMSFSAKIGTKGHSSYIAVVLAVSILVFTISGFAANISTSSGNAGQGNTITAGYTMSKVIYGGPWLQGASNNTSTNVTEYAFILKTAADSTGTSTATNENTVVWAQLTTSTTNGNWTQCPVTGNPTPGNTICKPAGSQQKPLSQVTGVNIIARDRNSDPTPTPFTPTNLPDLIVWLDASDTQTLTTNQANQTTNWQDKSGQNNNVTQNNLTNAPQQTTYLNKTALNFSRDPASHMTSTNQINITQGFTIFVVGMHRTRNNWPGLIRVGPLGTTASQYELYWQGGSTDTASGNLASIVNRSGTNSTSSVAADAPPPIGTPYIITAANTGTLLATNGTPRTTGTISTPNNPDILNVGAGYFSSYGLDGIIAEILIYNRSLTTTERQETEGYLAHKWTGPQTLPPTHPYYTNPPAGYTQN